MDDDSLCDTVSVVDAYKSAITSNPEGVTLEYLLLDNGCMYSFYDDECNDEVNLNQNQGCYECCTYPYTDTTTIENCFQPSNISLSDALSLCTCKCSRNGPYIWVSYTLLVAFIGLVGLFLIVTTPFFQCYLKYFYSKFLESKEALKGKLSKPFAFLLFMGFGIIGADKFYLGETLSFFFVFLYQLFIFLYCIPYIETGPYIRNGIDYPRPDDDDNLILGRYFFLPIAIYFFLVILTIGYHLKSEVQIWKACKVLLSLYSIMFWNLFSLVFTIQGNYYNFLDDDEYSFSDDVTDDSTDWNSTSGTIKVIGTCIGLLLSLWIWKKFIFLDNEMKDMPMYKKWLFSLWYFVCYICTTTSIILNSYRVSLKHIQGINLFTLILLGLPYLLHYIHRYLSFQILVLFDVQPLWFPKVTNWIPDGYWFDVTLSKIVILVSFLQLNALLFGIGYFTQCDTLDVVTTAVEVDDYAGGLNEIEFCEYILPFYYSPLHADEILKFF